MDMAYVAGDGEDIVGDARHVAADVLAPVVDARVSQREKRDLYELSKASRHQCSVLGGNSKFKMVELTDVLQKGTSVCEDLADRSPLNPVEAARNE